MKSLLTILTIILLLTSCTTINTPINNTQPPTQNEPSVDDTPPPETPTTPPKEQTTTAPLTLPLNIGETKKATDTLTISFTKILTDSRCPIDATCIWQGEATAELVLRNTNTTAGQDNRRTINLSTQQPTTAWDYQLTLTDIRPTASTGRTILQREYSITIQIRGADATPPTGPQLSLTGQPCHGFEQRCTDGLACSGLYYDTPGTCIDEQDAKEDCERRNAEWGRWGLLGMTYCNPRTPDAGQVCNDNDQCQGYCIADNIETSRSGHCQELRSQFGCFSTLEDGEAGTSLCVD